MITGATKNKVDDIWQRMWEGGVTNPIEVIMQLTYLMFMKSLDDKELEAENIEMLGMTAKHVFPQTEEGQAIRWSRFKDLPAEQMFDVVSQKAFPFIKTMHSDNAFAESMEDAAFGFNKPKTLEKAVSGIDELLSNYVQDADDLGDLYEYMLSKLNTAGTNGQFRTPQHIRNMMVALAGPKPGQLICDPACGTAGFLISAAESIRKNHGQEMTEEQWKTFSGEQFTGFDTDQTMVRISAMNLLLHSIDHPDIRNQDSLSRLNAIRDKFDLILANPPFKGSLDADTVSADLLKICKTKKTELLFLALFLRMLRIGGRCACIVPDGVLFGSSTAHKAIRKELVDGNRLEAVISMPSGVFKPYAGVSTAVLVFTKTGAGGTENVWFYDMKADGFSLDDKRSEIAENDIPDIIERFHHLDQEADRQRTEQSFLVPKQEIADNDYDLSINKYKKVEYVPVEYPSTTELMADLHELELEITAGLAELEEML